VRRSWIQSSHIAFFFSAILGEGSRVQAVMLCRSAAGWYAPGSLVDASLVGVMSRRI